MARTPQDAAAADLAALCVAASAQALERQRLTRAYASDPAFVLKITARVDAERALARIDAHGSPAGFGIATAAAAGRLP